LIILNVSKKFEYSKWLIKWLYYQWCRLFDRIHSKKFETLFSVFHFIFGNKKKDEDIIDYILLCVNIIIDHNYQFKIIQIEFGIYEIKDINNATLTIVTKQI